MSGAENASSAPIYPARYFDESKTWFAWNKLTILDVCNLREEPGFQGQAVYFYLNHPVRYVRIVGIIVDVNLIRNTNLCIITIDDSSGANIEAKIRRDRVVLDASSDRAVEILPTTSTEDLEVHVQLGEQSLVLKGTQIGIGTIVKAQGTIDTFRGERQLDLKKLSCIRDTNEEAQHWLNVKKWKETVLRQPWVLTNAQRDAVDENLRIEEDRRRQKAKFEKKRRSQHDEKRQMRQAARERRRKEQEIKMNAGALKGSNHLPTPWEN